MYDQIKPILDQLDVELLRLRTQPLVLEHEAGVGSQAALVWIIDPIDGTNNYAHGLDMFGVSLGLWKQDGSGVFGIIDLPPRNTRIWGDKGFGVWLNGKQLTTPSLLYPEKPMLLLAPIWSDFTQASQVSLALAETVGHTRDHGSNVWQSFLVLIGQADANLSFRLSIWDIAAAVALAEELGLSVVFSETVQRSDLVRLADQPVTVAIGQNLLAEKLVTSVEPWTKL